VYSFKVADVPCCKPYTLQA